MNQWQYETIRRCIINGMPAAAQELVAAFETAVIALNDKMKAEAKKAEAKAPKDCNAKGGN